MSFVDLMADHRWSERDIINRTEAMVREHFPASAETIINRKLQGAAMGFALSPAEQAEVQAFQAVVLMAQAAGMEARADMALLAEAMAVEESRARLMQPSPGPVLGEVPLDPDTGEPAGEAPVTNQEEIDADTLERMAAEGALMQASPEALALADARELHRNPPPQPEPEEFVEEPADPAADEPAAEGEA